MILRTASQFNKSILASNSTSLIPVASASFASQFMPAESENIDDYELERTENRTLIAQPWTQRPFKKN